MKKLAPYKASVVEAEILDFWNKNSIFQKSLELRAGSRPFSFYDGPPFANGMPHFGHSLVTAIKDSIGRYQTMKGRYVARKNGWDCHGLPVEFAIEKKLNVSGKQQITELGIDVFNAECKASVFAYREQWEDIFVRLGRFSDLENAYATMNTSYTESVWWVLAQIHKKGLLYKGYKSMPYCPRCTTPLSNFELNEGYKDDVTDPSLYVKFQIKNSNYALLAWTTTPWSLPGNAALAVDEQADYVQIKLPNETIELVLAKQRLEVITGDYSIVKELNGSELLGLEYEPIFALPDTKEYKNLYKVQAANFVSLQDGTGIVHVAPAFGEDDLLLSKEKDFSVLNTVSSEGKLETGLDLEGIEGKFFKSADKPIIALLSEQGKVYEAGTILHTYPFCYRCDCPLLYYSIDTWFVAVSQIKNELITTAEQIQWMPANIKDGRFGKWLEGARDWAISRNRYWGAPMPIWVNEQNENDYIVVESIAELQKLAPDCGDLSDLHRPGIDSVVIKKDGNVYRRVEQVLDCWFESGAMPYASLHYPFENSDAFELSFPADYIGEGLDQTRLWFYVLHVISTILLNKPAYKQVLVNGMIMAADGQKMSKRLQNYPPFDDVLDNEGADALRFYLLSSAPAVTGEYMRFDRSALKDISRNVFSTLSNSVAFLQMYTTIDEWQPSSTDEPRDLHNDLDLWLVERVKLACLQVTTAADSYELSKATWPVYELLDDLSNWYIRRSRRRFWKSEDDSDKLKAYETLHWALCVTTQLMAPWVPFVADYYYQGLSEGMSGARESVHLSDWPVLEKPNQAILTSMSELRVFVNEGLAARAEANIKVRQPLADATIAAPQKYSEGLVAILAEELNVKNVLQKESKVTSLKLNTNITQTLKNEGIVRELIRNTAQIRKQQEYAVEDRIELTISTTSELIRLAVKEHEQLLKNEVLATTLELNEHIDSTKDSLEVESEQVQIITKKVQA